MGSVTFSSYKPDSRQNPLADVLFEIKKAGKTVCLLDGVYEDNIRSNETFNKVEAVSFPDYNSDGFNDIIIICSYSPASGPETGTGYPEVRIYSGNTDGSFAWRVVCLRTPIRPLPKRPYSLYWDFWARERAEPVHPFPAGSRPISAFSNPRTAVGGRDII